MAYTIVKSDGSVLTTIADGTINTTSTSLGLPGRNYAGYGQTLDTNFVWLTENFADTTPPANALTGQLWYNTNENTLYVCPSDGLTDPNAWVTLATTSANSTTTFGAIQVTGNLTANNITANNNITGQTGIFTNISVSNTANITTANITTGNITTLNTANINAGSNTTALSMTGVVTSNGTGTANSIGGTSMWVTGGNLMVSGSGNIGIKINPNYFYDLTGNVISLTGSYSNANVANYLPNFAGQIGTTGATHFGNTLTTGGNTVQGDITGNWQLSAGSRLLATYADLAERFEADAYYDAGTVVEMGGEKEITAVQYDLSDDVFGVVSDTAAYLMNSGAGDDITHPPVAVGGRVKVKVTGKVKKGQRLVSAGNGMARAALPGEATAFNIIGRALEDKITTEVGTVEAFVKIN